jgi:ABC-type nitrate/sulfonate/bicarbonate transport system permease component
MFAALFVLAIMAVCIYFLIDLALRRLITWQTEADPASLF